MPKTFAVCTIRSTPSTAHHCIAWAKSYLFPQLFGADEDADDLDEAEKNGENGQYFPLLQALCLIAKLTILASLVDEIQNLRKEAAAIKTLRATLVEPGASQRVFEKVSFSLYTCSPSLS